MKNLELKKLRPTLSEGSLTTYCSILRSLHRKLFGGDIQKDDFDESDKILKYLDDLPPNKRKTILSALVVISGKPDYRKEMLEDINDAAEPQDDIDALYDSFASYEKSLFTLLTQLLSTAAEDDNKQAADQIRKLKFMAKLNDELARIEDAILD